MPTIRDPSLTVHPIAGRPGLRLVRVDYVVDCAPFDPTIGTDVVERVVVKAIDEHDADVPPQPAAVFEIESTFLAAQGRRHRHLERPVHRTDLDVEQDWWETDQGGATVAVAEWLDHIAAEIHLVVAGRVVAEATSPVLTGSWGALGDD